MKHELKTITSSEWLNIVNSEAHPDISHYDLNCYKLDKTNYIISLRSGLGNWQHYFNPTGMTAKAIEKEFDKYTLEFKQAYDLKKDGTITTTGFMKNPMKPGL